MCSFFVFLVKWSSSMPRLFSENTMYAVKYSLSHKVVFDPPQSFLDYYKKCKIINGNQAFMKKGIFRGRSWDQGFIRYLCCYFWTVSEYVWAMNQRGHTPSSALFVFQPKEFIESEDYSGMLCDKKIYSCTWFRSLWYQNNYCQE